MKVYKFTIFLFLVFSGALFGQEKSPEGNAEEVVKEIQTSYSIDNLSDITEEDINTLLEFRQPLDYDSHGWTENDYFNDSTLDAFYNELLKKWVRPFNWQDWHFFAYQYYNYPEQLNNANLSDIVKLLTFHVRKDRYCEGHLLGIIQSGHMSQILGQLKRLRVQRNNIN